MLRKEEKRPIILIALSFFFLDKEYGEGKGWVDTVEGLVFLIGVGLTVFIIGIFPLGYIIYRKQKRVMRYLRQYESLPGGNDPV